MDLGVCVSNASPGDAYAADKHTLSSKGLD